MAQPVNGEVHVVADVPAAFAELVAAEVAKHEGGIFSMALSGGPTARRCYERLASTDGIDWTGVAFYWGDERCVPADDPDSNQRLGREALLDAIGDTAGVHPMNASECSDELARAYEDVIRPVGGFDLLHLGFGPDGHTASLFAGSPGESAPSERLVVCNSDPNEANPHERMTITYPVIDAAHLAVFTVSGVEKSEAFGRLLAGEDLPAARVR
ncbi:MAG TPA: 6-phosphogluconolactonase, partial [Acidimicrobiales bacterium]|nr:6-phosphogluconolactonase [Acidimicrobiales bacterium]